MKEIDCIFLFGFISRGEGVFFRIIDDNTDRVSDYIIFSDALGFDITGFVSVT